MTVADETIPTISVALAVYNGENYLAEAMESILAQTYTDFELVVVDNASTDGTADIVRKFAERDPRVRYFRNETNIGGARNQARSIELSRGRYIRLAAHDDRVAPTLLEECMREMAKRPEAVIVYPATTVIEADGTENFTYQSTRGTAKRPSQRFRELAFRVHNCDAIYGLMNGDVLRGTRPMGNFVDGDKSFLCDLAMQGPFVSFETPLFYKRYHPKNYMANWRDRMAWYNPHKKGKPSFPNWLELGWFSRVALTARIPLRERLLCLGTVAAWAVVYSPKLAKDLIVAAQMIVFRALRKQTPAPVYNWE